MGLRNKDRLKPTKVSTANCVDLFVKCVNRLTISGKDFESLWYAWTVKPACIVGER